MVSSLQSIAVTDMRLFYSEICDLKYATFFDTVTHTEVSQITGFTKISNFKFQISKLQISKFKIQNLNFGLKYSVCSKYYIFKVYIYIQNTIHYLL